MKFHITHKGDAFECRARQGRCPFGGENEHYGTQEEAVRAFEARNEKQTFALHAKPVSISLLQNSSFEVGYSARAYFRLLNHQDYTQAKDLYGKVKDQSVIDAVKEVHRADSHVETLKETKEKTMYRAVNAKTQAQHDGYLKSLEGIDEKIVKAEEAKEEATVAIDQLKAKYAKELAIHNNSLKALERLASSNRPLARPKGIEGRIKELQRIRQDSNTIKPVSDLLGDGEDHNKTAQAAELYGVKEYIESTRRLAGAHEEKAELERIEKELNTLVKQAPSDHARSTIENTLEITRGKLRTLNPTIAADTPRVAVFKDLIRDRRLYENDVTRELHALVKLEARTRN